MNPTAQAGGDPVPYDPTTPVSVAVPVYNGMPYLAETLESIRCQSHKALEIVVVDDASTDDSLSLAQAYARRDSRIRVLHNAHNIGMVPNWNRTIATCTGAWIHLTGQDDLRVPDAIETALRAVRPTIRLVLAERAFSFEPSARRFLRTSYIWELPTLRKLHVTPGVVTPADMAALLPRLTSPCTNFLGEPVCGLVRRDVFDSPAPYLVELTQLADYEFWLRCVLAEPFVYMERRLFTFRVHGQSATHTHIEDPVRGIHLEYARLLLELAYGTRYTTVRQRFPRLIPLWEEALMRQIMILKKLAASNARAAGCIAEAAALWPGLGAALARPVPMRYRTQLAMQTAMINLRRLGSIAPGVVARLRPSNRTVPCL